MPLGHDKMILSLAVAHASILNTPRQVFFSGKSVRETFFVLFVGSYHYIFLATFYLIHFHLLMQMLTLEIHNFEPEVHLARAIIDIIYENQLS